VPNHLVLPTALIDLGKGISRRRRCVRRAKPGILTESTPMSPRAICMRRYLSDRPVELESARRVGRAHVHSAKPAMAMNKADPSMAGMKMDDLPLPQTPWAVGATHVPHSTADTADATIALDKVVALGCQAGVKDGSDIPLLTTAEGVYTVSYFPADPEAERTLHIDRYSSQILSDISHRDYGRVAKWIS